MVRTRGATNVILMGGNAVARGVAAAVNKSGPHLFARLLFNGGWALFTAFERVPEPWRAEAGTSRLAEAGVTIW